MMKSLLKILGNNQVSKKQLRLSNIFFEDADDVAVDEVVGVVGPHEVEMRIVWQMAFEQQLRGRQVFDEPIDVARPGEPVALRQEEQRLHRES